MSRAHRIWPSDSSLQQPRSHSCQLRRRVYGQWLYAGGSPAWRLPCVAARRRKVLFDCPSRTVPPGQADAGPVVRAGGWLAGIRWWPLLRVLFLFLNDRQVWAHGLLDDLIDRLVDLVVPQISQVVQAHRCQVW
jgi:hypothetical protein